MRVALLLCFMLLCMSMVFAQSRWSAGIDAQIGFTGLNKGVAHNSDFRGTTFFYSQKNILLPNAGGGLWAQYQLSTALGFRFGLGYLNSGSSSRELVYTEVINTGQKTLSRDDIYRLRVHQLQMPFELVYKPGKRNVRPYFSLGIQVSRVIRGSIQQEKAYAEGVNLVFTWNKDAIYYLDKEPWLLIQPIASVGLSINDQMTLRFRYVWAKAQTLNWLGYYNTTQSFNATVSTTPSGPREYNIADTHQQLISLQFNYRIF